jgi:2-polyprenyl-3-methyl-5-hydroxy-6-metoxy-1,4-benzoquinol methylase
MIEERTATELEYSPYCEGGKTFEVMENDFSTRLFASDLIGHARFNPMPDEMFLQGFYNGGFSNGGNEVYNLAAQYGPSTLDVARGVKKHMQAFANLPDSLNFHDFGCAFGALVYGFQQIGARATGSEPNKSWVAAGNNYCNGALTSLDLPDALAQLDYKIDLLTALHVIEHLSDPLRYLRTIRDHLSDNGILYICVPNADCVQYMLGGRLRDPFYYFPMHLQYFTAKSMAWHLREADLEIFYADTRWLPDTLNPEGYVFEKIFNKLAIDLPNPEAMKAALCANLLGQELFVLAGHPGNRSAERQPDLDERIERAFNLSRHTVLAERPMPDLNIAVAT